MTNILDQLKRRTAQEVEKRVNASLPPSMQLKLNPEGFGGSDEDEEDEEEGDEEDEDEEEGDEEEGDEPLSIAFEDASAEDNLACAVAAFRIAGGDGLIVATHSTGCAFFGDEDDLDEYSSGKDLDEDGWEVYDNPEELLKMEYDHDTLKRIIRMIEERESKYEDAEDFYEKFHWGNKPNVQVVKNIPGVTGTLVHLGVARRVDYGSNKDGKWEEYFHEFGENTDVYPSVYAVMNEGETEPTCLVIHGGNMRVEPRGVVE